MYLTKYRIYINILLVILLLSAKPSYSQLVSNITYQYDPLNRLVEVQYPNGMVIQYEYDEVGNRTMKSSENLFPANAGTISGITSVCQGAEGITYSVNEIENAEEYEWALPPGAIGSSSANNITVNYSLSAISGEITVKGINEYGEGGSSSIDIVVNPLPIAAGTITGNQSICQGETGISYSVPEITNATSYVWSLPEGASGTSSSNSILVDFGANAQSGNINVKGLNDCGEGTSSSLSVTVNTLPIAAGTITGNQAICQGETGISYSVPEITNATSYVWSLPEGASGTSSSNSILVDFGTNAQSGNITVKGLNDCGEGTSSFLAITINPAPGLTVGDDFAVCQGEAATLTADFTNGPLSWDNDVENGIPFTPTQTQTYTATVVSDQGCGTLTESITVTVHPLPELSVEEDFAVCSGEQVTLTATHAHGTLSWDQGVEDGVPFVPTETQTYQASVISDYGCGALTESVIVTVTPAPGLTIGDDFAVCQGEAVTLTADFTHGTLSWDNDVVNGIPFTPTQTQTYTATVVSDQGCGTLTESITVTVHPLPELSVEEDFAVCSGEQVTLTATHAHGTLTWGQGVEDGVPFVPTETQTYQASVISEYGCGELTESVTVTVTPAPELTIGDDFAVCQGEAVTLTADFTHGTLSWDNDVVNGIPFTPTQTQTYTATVVSDQGCGTLTESITVTVHPLPELSVEEDFAVCSGEQVTLTATHAHGTLSWDQGVEDGVPFVPTETQTYQASVISDYGCGALTESVTVTVNPAPGLTVGDDFAVCAGEAVTLTADFTHGTLSWDNDVENGIPFTPTQTQTYTATVVSDQGCGTLTESITVTVHPLPELSVEEDFAVCSGEQVTLTATHAHGTLSWDQGVEDGVPFVPTETQTYQASVISDYGCGELTESVTVTVNPLPEVTIADFEALCLGGEDIELTGGEPQGGVYYIDNEEATTFSPLEEGEFTISYFFTNENGCIGYISTIITVDQCVQVTEYDNKDIIIYPNPTNGLFTIEVYKHFNLIVTDMSGKLVYEKNIDKGKSTLHLYHLHPGIYFLSIETEDFIYTKKLIINK